MLYFWRSSPWTLLPLGAAAVCAILFGYAFFAGSPTIGDALDSMVHRLFVYQGVVVWDLHREGELLPACTSALLPMFGYRIFSLVAGITRDNQLEWVMSHFGLMITHLSGYSTEFIVALSYPFLFAIQAKQINRDTQRGEDLQVHKPRSKPVTLLAAMALSGLWQQLYSWKLKSVSRAAKDGPRRIWYAQFVF